MERFEGEDGQRLLIEALSRQVLIGNDRDLAGHFADHVELVEFDRGHLLIAQAATDNSVYLLLMGRAAVEINGQEMAVREAGNHVGEMAAIDPASPRSASVRAIERVVAARIGEPSFTALATEHPEVYRRMALEIADRLRQRSRFVRVPNDRPQVFIGSSGELIDAARAIQKGLAYDDYGVRVWTDGIFKPSDNTVDALIDAATVSDFGILVVGPDDDVVSRGDAAMAPRDNVIFELGLFMGAVGKERTVIVRPRGVPIKLPSDLLGVTPLEFDPSPSIDDATRFAPVCTDIRELVSRLGVK